jgi:O-antigen/teichoic acid export membrane protein
MIARKSMIVFANTIFGAILGGVSFVFIGHAFDPATVGEFEYTLGLLGLFYFLTDFGFGYAHTKKVSEGVDEGDCLATFAVFKLVATGLFVALGLLAVVYVQIHPQALVNTTAGIVGMVTLYYALKSLGAIPNATFDAKRETARSQASVAAENFVRVPLLILLAALYGSITGQWPILPLRGTSNPVVQWIVGNPAAAYGATFALGALASFGLAIFYVRRTSRFGRFRAEILRSYWQFAVPIALVSLVSVVATYVDKALLGFFFGDSQAAFFAYARKFGVFIESIPVATSVLLFPTISSFHGKGDMESIRRTRELATRYTALFFIPITAFAMVFSRPVVHLILGDKWLPVAPAFAILGIYSLAYTLATSHTSFLSGTGQVRTVARVALVAAGLTILLNLLLIPVNLSKLGIQGVELAGLSVNGAAIAASASMTVAFVLYRWEASRLAPVQDGFLLRQAAAAIVMVLVLLGVYFTLFHTLPFGDLAGVRWYHYPLLVAVGAAVYFAALTLLGEFDRRDVDFILQTVNPRDLVRYLNEELRPRAAARRRAEASERGAADSDRQIPEKP